MSLRFLAGASGRIEFLFAVRERLAGEDQELGFGNIWFKIPIWYSMEMISKILGLTGSGWRYKFGSMLSTTVHTAFHVMLFVPALCLWHPRIITQFKAGPLKFYLWVNSGLGVTLCLFLKKSVFFILPTQL